MSNRTSPALLGFCFDFLTLRFLNSFSRGLAQIRDNKTMKGMQSFVNRLNFHPVPALLD